MNISASIGDRVARRSCSFYLCIAVALGLLISTAQAEKLPPDAVKRIMNGTVYIETYGVPVMNPRAREQVLGSGTGFIVDKNGLVLTNAHVVAPVVYLDKKLKEVVSKRRISANKNLPSVSDVVAYQRTRITVRLRSGRTDSKVFGAQLVEMRWEFAELHKGRDYDFALLRISADEPLVPLSTFDEERDEAVTLLDDVWTFGFPHGSKLAEFSGNPNGPDLSVRSGQVTSLRHSTGQSLVKIEHNCGTEGGNSGGPMVNSHGKVVGINTWSYGTQSKFAIPIDMGSLGWVSLNAAQSEKTAKRSTLRVDPTNDNAFATIADALRDLKRNANGNPGHTIQLSSGRHVVASKDDVKFDEMVIHIRGEGSDKTKLVLEQSFPQSKVIGNGPDLGVLSNMTVEVSRTAQLEFLNNVIGNGGIWVLHDIAIRRCQEGAIVVIEETARVSMFNCKFFPENAGSYPDIAVKGGRLRMQGVRNCALIVDRGDLFAEGCQFNRLFRATGDFSGVTIDRFCYDEWWQPLMVVRGGRIQIEGCNFALSQSKIPQEVNGDEFYSWPHLKHIHILGDCDLNLVGNYFDHDLERTPDRKIVASGGIRAYEVSEPEIHLNNFLFFNAIGRYQDTFSGGRAFIPYHGTALSLGMKDRRQEYTKVRNNLLLNARVDIWGMAENSGSASLDEENAIQRRNINSSTARFNANAIGIK